MMKTLKIAAFLIFLCGVIFTAYAYFIEPDKLVTHTETIVIPQLDPFFNNLKIVAVSDIHGGSRGGEAAKIRQIVARINEQQPDVVVLLGDFVSEYLLSPDNLKMPMREISDNLSGITAKYGVYAVLGNHDGRFSDDAVRIELQRIGYTVLENQLAAIEKDGHRLWLYGLADHMKISSWTDFNEESRKLFNDAGTPADIIVLEHAPDIIPNVLADPSIPRTIRLILCGHTHGGQIRLPVVGAPGVPSNYGQKYARGHLTEGGVDIFVTTGTGTSVLPLRFNVPPEIAVLTITNGG